ncbi:hypothetical protein [Streptomyces rubiginosohelvolus]|uniref:Uncharacterized protein n=1 Tax=Streptomyces rubiginosohelvolus TaxID=67362 RepID=A0ABQ3BNA7_9ACTN|nr:hypothetical protein [Streptomyces pluricolorescens]GGZ51683.1 hypothetical protein GCM10010328_27940 [Streptomyces pluricolorescens]
MSDHQEARTEDLMRRLSNFAHGINLAMAALPIPMTLPSTGEVSLIGDYLPAAIRAYEIVDEQPLPELQLAQATTALLHWITAAELTVGYTLSGAGHRADGAVLLCMGGEQHLADLIEFLVDPEGTEPPQD